MSKSVLVIDTPSGCTNCPLFYYNEMYSSYECKGTSDYNRTIKIYGYKIKPTWCPLSSLPERINLRQYTETDTTLNIDSLLAYQYAQGWNNCIYDILEGEKGER